jgi:peroxiredoxin
MKRWSLFLLFISMAATIQAQLRITGKITGLADGAPVFMTDANNPSDTIAKSTVKNGLISLTAKLKEPVLAHLWFGKTNNIINFFDNSKITVSGDMKALNKISLKGSPTVNDFNEFQKIFNPYFDKLMKNNQQMQTTGVTEALMQSSNSINDTIQQLVDVFIAKHDASPVSAFLLTATLQLKDDILLADTRFNKLKPAAIGNLYGNYLKQVIDDGKATAIGSIAMDFTQEDTLGIPVSLSSFRGKYVLLDFWASWCGPCRQENPNVVNNFHKFKDKNFTVLGVSLDRPGQKDKWIGAIHMDNLAWTHVSDLQYWNNAVARKYKVESIPQNFLIGPDGKIIAKNLRGPALENKLCELLGCN